MLHHLPPVFPSQRAKDFPGRNCCFINEPALAVSSVWLGSVRVRSPGPAPFIFLSCQCHLLREKAKEEAAWTTALWPDTGKVKGRRALPLFPCWLL